MSMTVVVCIAVLGALVFLLGANVTRLRAVRGKSGGEQASTDPADRLFIAIRAHGNAAEYVPTLIGLIVVCAFFTDGWWLATLAVVAVVARLSHAVGMLTSKTLASHGPLRDFGAMATYASGLALAITAVVTAL